MYWKLLTLSLLLGAPARPEPPEDALMFAEPAVRGWMSEAYRDAEAGRFEAARAKIAKARSFDDADPLLKDEFERASELARVLPEWNAEVPGKYSELLQKGALSYFYGRDGEAFAALREAAKLDSEDGRAGLLLSELSRSPGRAAADPTEKVRRALAQGRLDQAVRLSHEILRQDPKNILAYLCLALARYRQGDVQGAIRALDSAARYEKSEQARRALRSNARALDRLARSRSEAKPSEKGGASPSAELDRLYDQGLQAYARGELEEAERIFRRILAAAPDDEKAAKAVRRIEAERGSARP